MSGIAIETIVWSMNVIATAQIIAIRTSFLLVVGTLVPSMGPLADMAGCSRFGFRVQLRSGGRGTRRRAIRLSSW